MSRRRRCQPQVGQERWLVSYADFITLLFAFFVVLYASSQVGKTGIGEVAAAIEGAFHDLGTTRGSGVGVSTATVANPDHVYANTDGIGEAGATRTKNATTLDGHSKADVDHLQHELELVLAAEIRRREVALLPQPDGLVVSLREIGFFESGSPVLKPGSEPAVSRIAKLLSHRDEFVRVEGHTDNVPIHTAQFTSNWELSTARATEMIKLLISKYAFAPARLSAAGYGEFHPLASNATEDGRRQNRRLDLVILTPPARREHPLGSFLTTRKPALGK